MIREARKEDLDQMLELYLYLHEESIPQHDDHLAEAAARGLEALHEDGEDDEQHGFDSRCRRRCHEPAFPEVGEAHERHVAEEDDGDDGHHLTHGGDSLSVVETHFVFVIRMWMKDLECKSNTFFSIQG